MGGFKAVASLLFWVLTRFCETPWIRRFIVGVGYFRSIISGRFIRFMGNEHLNNQRSQSDMWAEPGDYDSTWEDEPDQTPETLNFVPRLLKACRNSRAAQDMRDYRHKCRKTENKTDDDDDDDDDDDYYNNAERLEKDDLQNVLFYKNLRSSAPDDVMIEDFHKNWKGDYERLEYVHSYIQWLFPIQEEGMNYRAYVLQPKEIKLFRKKQDLKERLLKSYKLMLDFYGVELMDEETGEVRRAANWRERFENLDSSTHNNLRITRILKCLGLLGFKHYQAPLVYFFLQETLVKHTLPRVKQSVLDYFLFAVLDPNERKMLIRFAFEHFKPREKFVWCPGRIRRKLEKELKPLEDKSEDHSRDSFICNMERYGKSKAGEATGDSETMKKLSSLSISGEKQKSDQQTEEQVHVKQSDGDTDREIKQSSDYVSQERHVTQESNIGNGFMEPANLQDDPENGTKLKISDPNSQKANDETTASDTETEHKQLIDLKNTDEDSRSAEEAPEAQASAVKCINSKSDNEATDEIKKTKKKKSNSELTNEEPRPKYRITSSEERSILHVDGNHDSNTVSDVSGTEVQQEGSEKKRNNYKPADETPGSDKKQETLSQDHQDKEHNSQSPTTDNLTESKTSADPNKFVLEHRSGAGSVVEIEESESVDGDKQKSSPNETSGQRAAKKNDVDNSAEVDTNVHQTSQSTEGSQKKSLNKQSGSEAAGGAVGNDTKAKPELKAQEGEKSQCSEPADGTARSPESTKL